MKTNFKTLALQAGVAAALATGSLSATAAITAVPAPAQLIPLFFYNTTGVDTGVRIVVPKSVGADTVIGILRGDSGLTPQTNWNSSQQFATTTTKQIHYWVMDINSAEIHNDKFPVTPDDEVYFYASNVLQSGVFSINGTALVGAAVPEGEPTYLILTTESAVDGGNPDFLFEAQAWLENTGRASSMASAVTIPVLGLADAADSTDYPTPGNNVIEDYQGAGPIASPIHTGIRTSGTSDVADFRVVDVPVHDNENSGDDSNNTIVVWTDANDTYTNVRQYNVNNAESQVSRGTISFPDQLNFLEVNAPFIAGTSSIGLASGYSSVLGDTNLANGGFVKLVIPAVALPADWAEQGAYNSVVIFNIPSIDGAASATNRDTDASELAIDTGWFSGQ